MSQAVRNVPLVPYFDAIESDRFEECAAMFAADAVYLRPSPNPGAGGAVQMSIVEGRGEILAFLRRRGTRPDRHRIYAASFDGTTCMVEGIVEGNVDFGPVLFMSCAIYDDDGLITRYSSAVNQLSPELAKDVYGGLQPLR